MDNSPFTLHPLKINRFTATDKINVYPQGLLLGQCLGWHHRQQNRRFQGNRLLIH